METSDDFKSLQDRIQKALVATTRSVNSLANEDLSFQRTASASVSDQLDEKNARLLGLASGLLRAAGRATGHRAPSLEEADDIDTHYKPIVDVIDSLLERADTCLDELTGVVKRKEAPTAEFGSTAKRARTIKTALDNSIRKANITKPQARFEHKPDNSDRGPWKPLLTTKPHAIIPLAQSLSISPDQDGNSEYDYRHFLSVTSISAARLQGQEDSELPQSRIKRMRRTQLKLVGRDSTGDADGQTRYKHPYETEILQLHYPETVYQIREPISYLPVQSATAIWVDTFEGVFEMLKELKEAREIAVDLEHHDYRTYNGLLSLMQISTRGKDWIVDTLQPWRHRLEILNEIFADPSIVKVFHGATMDITWLQRDLGLYVVGLVDTYHACHALGYPARSLAYLLKRFVDFDADKKYQLADWRIRPLPDEMFYYARSDTHYLLYIFDMVRNELVEQSDRSVPEKDMIDWVLQKSKETSLIRYTAAWYDPETGHGPRGWFNALVKAPGIFNGQQFAVYRALHKWRDETARAADESTMFIMSQRVLSDVARMVPSDRRSLLPLLHNVYQAHLVVDQLVALIQRAKEEGANGPSLADFLRADAEGTAAGTGHWSAEFQTSDQPVLNVEGVRSGHSQLWGPVAVSSVWDEEDTAERAPNLGQVAVPWATLVKATTAVKVQNGQTEGQQQASAQAEGGIRYVPEKNGQLFEDDKEFTLRAGRKRKSSAGDAEMAESSVADPSAALAAAMEISMDTDNEPADGEEAAQQRKRQEKLERRAARKAARQAAAGGSEEDGAEDASEAKRAKAEARRARKAAKRAQRASDASASAALGPDTQVEGGAEAEAPFDYSQAESLLHGAVKTTEPASRYDPYAAKTRASIPAARQHNYGKAGKTATFKN